MARANTENNTENPTPETGQSPADAEAGVTLEHTDGGATTRDAMDAGVPMAPAPEPELERVGPEDALGTEPTRGDYSGRIVAGPSLVSVEIPESEREPDGPKYKLVPQDVAPRV